MLEQSSLKSSPTGALANRNKFVQEVLYDYRICRISREVSLIGRKEVLRGKAKFGIFGDGKEVPQVAMAKAYKKGDYRAGYYRDQTLMFALGLCTVEEFFAQLFSDADHDPFSGGRQMNTHFASAFIDDQGQWIDHREHYNITSDVSCTAGQVGRALGLALASKKYRQLGNLIDQTQFSRGGGEVCFLTIGDGSTAEGAFWETVNAAGVLQVPLAISIWDDGYGISVPAKYQTTKGSISEILQGFQLDKDQRGLNVYRAKGWDYPTLCKLYEKGIAAVRHTHIPAVFHIEELTQPQGHSTSGSHERYKSEERLQWEAQHDCIRMMRQWILDNNLANEKDLLAIEAEAKDHVRLAKDRAWKAFTSPIKGLIRQLDRIYDEILESRKDDRRILQLRANLRRAIYPVYSDVIKNGRQLYIALGSGKETVPRSLKEWLQKNRALAQVTYDTHLYSNSSRSALKVPVVPPRYSKDSPLMPGHKILNHFFDKELQRNPYLLAFGEDVGKIGDVNQGFAGLQKKYGEERVFDTGIREWTIMGQAIGLAMRGFRPIAEIQYVDYLVYGLAPLTDDLATLRWRTNGIQMAPAIIRTRGHRYEGIWHAGSPMNLLLSSLRGIYLLVPRNMVQAAGFYNTMLQSDDPAVIVECLNGYRLKERLPDNIGSYTVPLGVPEVLQQGEDITIVTYGACVRVAQEAIDLLKRYDISVELIDVQSLLPFDLEHTIVSSLHKTNRVVFLDEDVPGGAAAYMMQKVLEEQGGYQYLDSPPCTITASEHRTPYGSDGSYFSKPNAEDVFERVYQILCEAYPSRFSQI